MTHWFDRRGTRISLRLLLVAPFLLQILVAMGMVGYLSYRSGGRAIETLAYDLMQSVTRQVLDYWNDAGLNQTTSPIQSSERQALQTFLHQLQIGKSGQVLVLDADQTLVAASVSSPPDGPTSILDRQSAQVSAMALQTAVLGIDWNTEPTDGSTRLALTGDWLLLYTAPAPRANDAPWRVVVAVPRSDFMAEINRNTSYITLWCALTLLVAAGTGLFTARWITQPIYQLNRAARRITEGQFDLALEPAYTRELRDLSATFSRMAHQLRASFKALSTSERRFRQVLEALPIGISVHRPDDSIVYLNPAGQRLLGATTSTTRPDTILSADQMFRAGTDQPYAPEDLPLAQAFQGKTVTVNDVEIRQLNRQAVFEVTAMPILDDQGGILYVLNLFQDITERRQAEALIADYNRQLQQEVAQQTTALGQSETTNKALLQAIPDLLVRVHRDGTILDLRASQSRLGADQPRWTVGQNFFAQLDTHQLSPALIHQALISRQVQTQIYTVETGTETCYEEARIVPCGDVDVLIIMRDVSDRKRAEAALQDSEERFRRSFDDAAVGMGLLTLEGNWIRVNPALCQLTGYDSDAMLSKTFQDITHPDDLRTDLSLVRRCLAGEMQTYQREKRYIHHQGHGVWVQINVSLVRNEAGQPLYFISQIQDISERRLVEQMKRDFISVVSHELRTPLTAIRGSLGLLASGIYAQDADKSRRMIDIAVADSERLVRLVNDILDLERLQSGQMRLLMEPCGVQDLIQQVVGTLQPVADQHQIDLHHQAAHLILWAAPDAVIQILTNLVGNAIKFSPAHSTIQIQVDPTDRVGPGTCTTTAAWSNSDRVNPGLTPDPAPAPNGPHPDIWALFSVRDQGRGIPIDQLDQIFDQFQQVDASDSREKGGTGLGLTICRAIVQQHGTRIWVESCIGQGSTFYFTLPLALAPPVRPRLSICPKPSPDRYHHG